MITPGIPFSIEYIKPSLQWQSVIENYLFVKDDRNGGHFDELLLPDKDLMLMVNLNNQTHYYQSVESQRIQPIQHHAYLFTHHTKGFSIAKTGGVRAFIVHFKPFGFHTLIRESLDVLPRNTIVLLEAIVGNQARQLTSRLSSMKNTASIQACFEDWLMENRMIPGAGTDALVEFAWQGIIRSSGRKKIELICREYQTSYKTLERRFNRYIGLTPKELSRIMRFRKAFDEYTTGSHLDFMQVVADNGYFDQMHLIKDFKYFTGYPPTMLKKTLDINDHLYHKRYAALQSGLIDVST